MVEQRRFKRFDIKMPLKLVRNGVRPVSAVGETHNVSSGGVLFSTDLRVDIGESIEYEVTLALDDASAPVTLHCLGKVMRFENCAGMAPGLPFQIAATLERYEFVREKARRDPQLVVDGSQRTDSFDH